MAFSHAALGAMAGGMAGGMAGDHSLMRTSISISKPVGGYLLPIGWDISAPLGEHKLTTKQRNDVFF